MRECLKEETNKGYSLNVPGASLFISLRLRRRSAACLTDTSPTSALRGR